MLRSPERWPRWPVLPVVRGPVDAGVVIHGGAEAAPTVYIVNLAESGTYGMAIAYASVLIVFMLVVITGIQLLIGERRLRGSPARLPVATAA